MTAAPHQGPHEQVSVQVFTAARIAFEDDLAAALNEIAATPDTRIISVAPGAPDSVGAQTFLITYATAPCIPGPAAASAPSSRSVSRGVAVPPGAYLAEYMEERGLDASGFARRLDWSEVLLDAVLRGRVDITPGMAARLEVIVGIPAWAWLRYEAVYRADLAAAVDMGAAVALPATEEDIHEAAKAISPNPKHWKEFVPTVRRVLTAIEKSQQGR